MTPLELIACLGVMFGFGAAAFGFGSVALSAYQALPALPSFAPPRQPQLGTTLVPQPPVPQPPVVSPRERLPARQVTFSEPHPSARCPVCCTGIQGQVRVCPSCRVLAHEDCWAFQGGCAIFGCCEKA